MVTTTFKTKSSSTGYGDLVERALYKFFEQDENAHIISIEYFVANFGHTEQEFNFTIKSAGFIDMQNCNIPTF